MDYYTIKQVAEEFAVHPNTIRNWIKADRIPALRWGPKTIRLSEHDVKALKERTTK
jgi:excisionase family DNA binding protein|tara:strand:- start:1015 stop:1182 length:168 start_codon:yes stop_codon:yes gene_type:complete